MAFRQFPAIGPDGETYVIIEFKDEKSGNGEGDGNGTPRYELADGRHLIRRGRQYVTAGGELTLSAA